MAKLLPKHLQQIVEHETFLLETQSKFKFYITTQIFQEHFDLDLYEQCNLGSLESDGSLPDNEGKALYFRNLPTLIDQSVDVFLLLKLFSKDLKFKFKSILKSKKCLKIYNV